MLNINNRGLLDKSIERLRLIIDVSEDCNRPDWMFFLNLVMSCMKKMTRSTNRSEESPTPGSDSPAAASRSRVDQDIVRESLGI